MDRIQLPGDILIDMYKEALALVKECETSDTHPDVTELAQVTAQIMLLEHPWLSEFAE